MTPNSVNHDVTEQIGQTLRMHTDIPKPYILTLESRMDRCANRDKVRDLLKGDIDGRNIEDPKCSLGNEAMFFTNANMDVTIEIVYASPLVDEPESSSEESDREDIRESWKECGGSTFDNPDSWVSK